RPRRPGACRRADVSRRLRSCVDRRRESAEGRRLAYRRCGAATGGVRHQDPARVPGSDDAMWAITQRVRLRVTLTTAEVSQTRVQVQREMIRRERILWGERDSGGASDDALAQRTLEERVLAAIAREL